VVEGVDHHRGVDRVVGYRESTGIALYC